MGVAKVVIIDDQEQYLMMWRSDHPNYPNDPDLPGGMIEAGETPEVAAAREVDEEAGIKVSESDLELLYKGSEYSAHNTEKSLYVVKLDSRPEVVISWEHSGYEWLSREAFLKTAQAAKDTYMHMVHDVVSQNELR
jgi:mutator protein MutT